MSKKNILDSVNNISTWSNRIVDILIGLWAFSFETKLGLTEHNLIY